MRRIEGKVDEKRPGLVLVNELACFLHHEVRKELAIVKDLLAVPPKVMLVGPAPVKEMRVVINATHEVAEGMIKALGVGDGLFVMPKVPLANMRGGVSSFLQFLRNRDLLRGHPDGIERDVAIQATMLRGPASHQAHP